MQSSKGYKNGGRVLLFVLAIALSGCANYRNYRMHRAIQDNLDLTDEYFESMGAGYGEGKLDKP